MLSGIASAAIEAGLDAIQLEKLDLEAVAQAAALASKAERPPLVIAAGGIDHDNAAGYVRAGAGFAENALVISTVIVSSVDCRH